jgi:hypothetical protein
VTRPAATSWAVVPAWHRLAHALLAEELKRNVVAESDSVDAGLRRRWQKMPEPGDPSAEQSDADRYPDNSALFHRCDTYPTQLDK